MQDHVASFWPSSGRSQGMSTEDGPFSRTQATWALSGEDWENYNCLYLFCFLSVLLCSCVFLKNFILSGVGFDNREWDILSWLW